MNEQKRVLIWDLPTRIFHWLMAIGFFSAAVIALTLDDHHPLFPYHALVGLTIALMVFLRLIWGFAGTRYARFPSFTFGPRAVLNYFRGILTGSETRHTGHNPGSAWTIFAMLTLLIALVLTGILAGRGYRQIKQFHELIAFTMIAVVAIHILGVILHIMRHRENIVASMIHGLKVVDANSAIPSARKLVAFIFIILICAWYLALYQNYDPDKRIIRLPVIGTTLEIGEVDDDEQPGQYNND